MKINMSCDNVCAEYQGTSPVSSDERMWFNFRKE